MEDCLFCKIVKGDIPSQKVYEDEFVYAFKDINPEAPVHIVVVPKCHIKNVNQINHDNSYLIAHIFEAIKKITEEEGIAEEGYRVVNNCGEQGGQTVNHLHFHLLGGRSMQWPPG